MNIFRVCITGLSLLFFLSTCIKKETVNPYGEGNGQHIFYRDSNLETLYFFVDGKFVDSVDNFESVYPKCEYENDDFPKDVVRYIGPAGPHTLDVYNSIKKDGDRHWQYKFKTNERVCRIIHVDDSLLVGGIAGTLWFPRDADSLKREYCYGNPTKVKFGEQTQGGDTVSLWYNSRLIIDRRPFRELYQKWDDYSGGLPLYLRAGGNSFVIKCHYAKNGISGSYPVGFCYSDKLYYMNVRQGKKACVLIVKKD